MSGQDVCHDESNKIHELSEKNKTSERDISLTTLSMTNSWKLSIQPRIPMTYSLLQDYNSTGSKTLVDSMSLSLKLAFVVSCICSLDV